MVQPAIQVRGFDATRAFELHIADWYDLHAALIATADDMTRLEARRWVKLMELSGVRPRHAVPIIGMLRRQGRPPEALSVVDVLAVRDDDGQLVHDGEHRRCGEAPIRSLLDVLDVAACLAGKLRHWARTRWPSFSRAMAAQRLYAAAGLAVLVLLTGGKCAEGDGTFSTDLPSGEVVSVRDGDASGSRKVVCVVADRDAQGFKTGRQYCRGDIPAGDVDRCRPRHDDTKGSAWPACRD